MSDYETAMSGENGQFLLFDRWRATYGLGYNQVLRLRLESIVNHSPPLPPCSLCEGFGCRCSGFPIHPPQT